MKIYFAIIIFLNISLIAWGYPADGNQDRKTHLFSKITTDAVSEDTLSQNIIQINGKEIDINGEANSVKIHQNGQTGSVNINQNGNGNQVNVTQSKLQD